MSYYSGSFGSVAAGTLISILDVDLILNSCWSIYDSAAGTNCKVYKCQDTPNNCLFYLKVDDNYSGYSIIELWEGWDATGHVGTGASLTLYGTATAMRLTKTVGGWGLCVRDHNMIWCDYAGNKGNYIGQPKRKDTSKNIVLYWGGGNSPASNPLGTQQTSGGTAAVVCAFLFDESGSKNPAVPCGAVGANIGFCKTSLGEIELSETRVVNYTTFLIIGDLDGVCVMGAATYSGVSNGDTCTIAGVVWQLIVATNYCWVQQA